MFDVYFSWPFIHALIVVKRPGGILLYMLLFCPSYAYFWIYDLEYWAACIIICKHVPMCYAPESGALWLHIFLR